MGVKDFQIEKSKDNYDIAKIRKDGKFIYIGSRYNMKGEIEKLLEKIENDCIQNEQFIVFGFAAGEHIKELRRKFPVSKIRVFEPNLSIKEYFEQVDWVRKDKKLELYDCSKESIVLVSDQNFINEFNLDRIKIISFSNYSSVYSSELVELLKQVKESYLEMIVESNTKVRFSERWFKTIINNLPYIADSVLIDKHKNLYENKPAIIVSAGPSLDKNINLLRDIEKKFLIITGGRPLKGLIQKNIEPGLLVALDPQMINYELVKGYIEETNIPLLFFDTTNEKIVKNHRGYKMFSTYNEFIFNVLDGKAKVLPTEGSVAHSMVSAAALLGCNPIIFIGQDFAYTNERAHSPYLEEKHNDNNFKSIKSDMDIWVEDINGGKVRTSNVLNMYRLGMEKIISEYPEIQFINATEGGARICGTIEMTLKEVIKKYGKEEVKKIPYIEPDIEFKERMIKELRKMCISLVSIRKECVKANSYVNDLKNSNNIKKNDEIILKLNRIDKSLNEQIMQFSIIHTLLYPTLYDILTNNDIDNKKSECEKKQIVINQSRKLYNALISVIDNNIDEIKVTINKIYKEEKNFV